MKLSDPFSWYLLAYGNVVLHLGYFAAILHIPKCEVCDKGDYELSWKLLLASHAILSVLFIIKVAIKKYKEIKGNNKNNENEENNEKNSVFYQAFIWISIFFYQGSIFYT